MAEDTVPPYAGLALSLTVPEWTEIGVDPATVPTPDIEVLTDRITSLLLIRIVAQVCPEYANIHRANHRQPLETKNNGRRFERNGSMSQMNGHFSTSTMSICRTALMKQEPWPEPITMTLIQQLRAYVKSILSKYNNVPYHSCQHATHVTLSVNKLIDMMWDHENVTNIEKQPKSFGLKHDPLCLTALIFSALIHDVEHRGVTNRQLAAEDDELAILYNDESIAENRSLFVAFYEFLRPEYTELRTTLFPSKDEYRRFRKHVVNLVLNTDIASPERTQLFKSKWKEAFGKHQEHDNQSVSSLNRSSLDNSLHSQSSFGDDENPDEDDMLKYVRKPVDNKDKSESDPVDKDNNNNNNNNNANGGDDDDMLKHVRKTNGGKTPAPGPAPGSAESEESKDREDDMLRYAQQRHRSMPAVTITEAKPATNRAMSVSTGKFGRSMSAPETRSFRKRLGIRRSMDLSGEALEAFSSHKDDKRDGGGGGDDDDTDELKSSVVMECIMTAADVAHNLQGWEQMVTWSSRLYKELRKAYVDGRGIDVSPKWFENQIGFLESYLLPLAKQLDTTGVFGTGMQDYNQYEYADGPQRKRFADIVVASRDKWLLDGMDVADEAIRKGNEEFPMGGFVDV